MLQDDNIKTIQTHPIRRKPWERIVARKKQEDLKNAAAKRNNNLVPTKTN